MAGAPVSGELISRLQSVLPDSAEIHTPYGATESLPIASITGSQILAETWRLTQVGKGTCVGRPLPGMEIRIIKDSDAPIARLGPEMYLPAGEIGEIIVKGPVVTRAYDNRDQENRLAKINNKDGLWHRIGDLGYMDSPGRLWFCGRQAHKVTAAHGPMYTICCEAVFNRHPQVFRSALVGVGPVGRQRPVIIVELQEKVRDQQKLFDELGVLALEHEHTASIKDFLVHKSFPVDIRHNAKIFREKLAVWAAEVIC